MTMLQKEPNWAMRKAQVFKVYRGLYYTAIWGLEYTIMRYYKDPYVTTRITESKVMFFRGSIDQPNLPLNGWGSSNF